MINVIVILGVVFFAFVVVVAIKVAMAGMPPRPPPRKIKLAPLQAADPGDLDSYVTGVTLTEWKRAHAAISRSPGDVDKLRRGQ